MPALAVALALASIALFAPGCGGESDQSAADAEKANDIAILNTALGYEMVAVDAYTQALALLRGEDLALARELRAQQQEHVNAITKVIRGLGGRTDPEPIEPGCNANDSYDMSNALHRDGGGQAEALTLVYCQVNAAIAEDMAAVSKLANRWPRTLIAMIAANEAQQLTLLRQALGVEGAASVPEAFENGETPPPGE
jgi:hypothetical protein